MIERSARDWSSPQAEKSNDTIFASATRCSKSEHKTQCLSEMMQGNTNCYLPELCEKHTSLLSVEKVAQLCCLKW